MSVAYDILTALWPVCDICHINLQLEQLLRRDEWPVVCLSHAMLAQTLFLHATQINKGKQILYLWQNLCVLLWTYAYCLLKQVKGCLEVSEMDGIGCRIDQLHKESATSEHSDFVRTFIGSLQSVLYVHDDHSSITQALENVQEQERVAGFKKRKLSQISDRLGDILKDNFINAGDKSDPSSKRIKAARAVLGQENEAYLQTGIMLVHACGYSNNGDIVDADIATLMPTSTYRRYGPSRWEKLTMATITSKLYQHIDLNIQQCKDELQKRLPVLAYLVSVPGMTRFVKKEIEHWSYDDKRALGLAVLEEPNNPKPNFSYTTVLDSVIKIDKEGQLDCIRKLVDLLMTLWLACTGDSSEHCTPSPSTNKDSSVGIVGRMLFNYYDSANTFVNTVSEQMTTATAVAPSPPPSSPSPPLSPSPPSSTSPPLPPSPLSPSPSPNLLKNWNTQFDETNCGNYTKGVVLDRKVHLLPLDTSTSSEEGKTNMYAFVSTTFDCENMRLPEISDVGHEKLQNHCFKADTSSARHESELQTVTASTSGSFALDELNPKFDWKIRFPERPSYSSSDQKLSFTRWNPLKIHDPYTREAVCKCCVLSKIYEQGADIFKAKTEQKERFGAAVSIHCISALASVCNNYDKLSDSLLKRPYSLVALAYTNSQGKGVYPTAILPGTVTDFQDDYGSANYANVYGEYVRQDDAQNEQLFYDPKWIQMTVDVNNVKPQISDDTLIGLPEIGKLVDKASSSPNRPPQPEFLTEDTLLQNLYRIRELCLACKQDQEQIKTAQKLKDSAVQTGDSCNEDELIIRPDNDQRQKRKLVWDDAVRELQISGDPLYAFLRQMAGLLHEDVQAIVKLEERDNDVLTKQQLDMQRETIRSESVFQNRIVETLMTSVIKESRLRLDLSSATASAGSIYNGMVVISNDALEKMKTLSSGQSGLPFFEGGVELERYLSEVNNSPTSLGELLRNVRQMLERNSVARIAQMTSTTRGAAGLEYIMLPRNSFVMRLRNEAYAAIRSAYDSFTREWEYVYGNSRPTFAYTLIEGQNSRLCNLFASLCAYTLAHSRMYSSSASAYVGRDSAKANTIQMRLALARLIQEAGKRL